MKIPAIRAAVDKEWEQLEKIPAWEKQIWSDRWSKKKKEEKCTSPHWWTDVIWRMPNWRQSHEKYKGWIVLRGDIVQRRCRVLCSIHWTRILTILQDAQDKQLTQFLLTTQIENGRCSKTIESFITGMSRHLDSSTTTQMAKNHGPVLKFQSFLLKGIRTVILWQDCSGKGNLQKFFLKYAWEKVSNWECFFVHREKGFFLSMYADDTKIGWKETKS